MSHTAVKKCEKGTGAVELAFIAPVLTLFVLGMIDVGGAIATRYSLTRASILGTELAQSVGEVDGRYDYLLPEVANYAKVPVNNVKVNYWLECDYIEQPDTVIACVPPSLPFRYLRVSVSGVYQTKYIESIIGPSVQTTGMSVVRVQ